MLREKDNLLRRRSMKKPLIAVTVVVLMLSMASIALANGPYLNVDGVVYSPSQVSGPVNHYTTPDISPSSAFSDRHTWLGHGGEQLPCQFGIHWVDNANVLTVSHCLEGETTTTTTIPATTTTTITEETTTTETHDTTTTTQPEASTTTIGEETTTTVSVPVTLPETGAGQAIGLLASAMLLLFLGAVLITGARNQ
jgi:hypothetical protein